MSNTVPNTQLAHYPLLTKTTPIPNHCAISHICAISHTRNVRFRTNRTIITHKKQKRNQYPMVPVPLYSPIFFLLDKYLIRLPINNYNINSPSKLTSLRYTPSLHIKNTIILRSLNNNPVSNNSDISILPHINYRCRT